jgi:hypothetical protein
MEPEDRSAAQPVPELGSATPFDDEAVPEPSGADLLHSQGHAVLDRLVCIADHMQAIAGGLLDIGDHQRVIAQHFRALKDLIQRETMP